MRIVSQIRLWPLPCISCPIRYCLIILSFTFFLEIVFVQSALCVRRRIVQWVSVQFPIYKPLVFGPFADPDSCPVGGTIRQAFPKYQVVWENSGFQMLGIFEMWRRVFWIKVRTSVSTTDMRLSISRGSFSFKKNTCSVVYFVTSSARKKNHIWWKQK